MAVEPLSRLPNHSRNYYATLGRLVVEWNLAEATLRTLLNKLAGPESFEDEMRAHLLTAELGSTGLAQALRSHADTMNDRKLVEAIDHAVKCYENLRGHRNYYVHGIVTLLPISKTKTVGHIHYFEAKGRLIQRRDRVTVSSLNDVYRWAIGLRRYAHGIVTYLVTQRMVARGLPPRHSKLPRKLRRPPQVQKSARHLGVPSQSPQASGLSSRQLVKAR